MVEVGTDRCFDSHIYSDGRRSDYGTYWMRVSRLLCFHLDGRRSFFLPHHPTQHLHDLAFHLLETADPWLEEAGQNLHRLRLLPLHH